MKHYKNHRQKIKGVIRDLLIVILSFFLFAIIDLQIASFIAVILISILLTRRIILDLNPGFIAGHKIINNGKQLVIPKGVDVFELKDSSSFDTLSRYVGILQFITITPRVLIISFKEVLYIDSERVDILSKTINKLSEKNISIIFSDLDWNLLNQLKPYDLYDKVGESNICDNISHALVQVKKRYIT